MPMNRLQHYLLLRLPPAHVGHVAGLEHAAGPPVQSTQASKSLPPNVELYKIVTAPTRVVDVCCGLLPRVTWSVQLSAAQDT